MEAYRGTSLIRNSPLLGPYSRAVSRAQVGGVFLMSEVPLNRRVRVLALEIPMKWRQQGADSYRGGSLIRKRHPPQDRHRALDTNLL